MTISLEDIPADSRITSLERLDALYGEPSKRAMIKEIDHISAEYQVFVEKSPFVILASSGPGGLDCSPRAIRPALFVCWMKKPCCCPTGSATTAPIV